MFELMMGLKLWEAVSGNYLAAVMFYSDGSGELLDDNDDVVTSFSNTEELMNFFVRQLELAHDKHRLFSEPPRPIPAMEAEVAQVTFKVTIDAPPGVEVEVEYE